MDLGADFDGLGKTRRSGRLTVAAEGNIVKASKWRRNVLEQRPLENPARLNHFDHPIQFFGEAF